MVPDGSPRSRGTTAVLVGGAMIMLGSTLTWAKLAMNMPGAGSKEAVLSGMSAGDGKITLALGAIAIAVAIASVIVGRKGGLGTGLAVVSIAAGGFASILGVTFAMDIRTQALDYAIAQAGQRPADYAAPARQILDQATSVSSGWGLYLVILGGIVTVTGGILAAITLRQGMASAATEDQPEGTEDVEALQVEEHTSTTDD